jgi:hypothetical protein
MSLKLNKRIRFVEKTIGELIEQYNKCSAKLLEIEIKQYKYQLRELYDQRRRIRKATNGSR